MLLALDISIAFPLFTTTLKIIVVTFDVSSTLRGSGGGDGTSSWLLQTSD